jgi:hypothetical protein
LSILDCRAAPLFAASYPERMFDGFAEAPPVLVQSLLFIENRELLDPGTPTQSRRGMGPPEQGHPRQGAEPVRRPPGGGGSTWPRRSKSTATRKMAAPVP